MVKILPFYIIMTRIFNTTWGGSRAAATSKMECIVIIVNGWKPLTIIIKHSILDVAAALDPPNMSINIGTLTAWSLLNHMWYVWGLEIQKQQLTTKLEQ